LRRLKDSQYYTIYYAQDLTPRAMLKRGVPGDFYVQRNPPTVFWKDSTRWRPWDWHLFTSHPNLQDYFIRFDGKGPLWISSVDALDPVFKSHFQDDAVVAIEDFFRRCPRGAVQGMFSFFCRKVIFTHLLTSVA